MPEKTKVVTLPSAEEIMARLKKVNDDDCMAERFYPLIAWEAGREPVAEGVVMMLALKIHDFVSSGYPPVMTGHLAHVCSPLH